MKLLLLFFLFFIGLILTHPDLSLKYASVGLQLWFEKMIPTLLPFMILSGIMVRMQLTEKLSMLFYPVMKPVFRINKNVCYCMMMGFLCGFPMGAKVAADLYKRQMISRREAEYLLSFCNNIGPVYFCSFVLPLLGRKRVLPYLFGMYGIPLLYGVFLRYTFFRGLQTVQEKAPLSTELRCCEKKVRQRNTMEQLLAETNEAVIDSVQSMLTLGGYMILFNLLNLIPYILLGHRADLIAPLFEITGGLVQLRDTLPMYSLLVLSFGGFSCIAQTYSCISKTDLAICDYILHKVTLTLLNGIYYLGWFFLAPESFLC